MDQPDGDSPIAPPNILLICVDQWRADCFSAAGHPVVMTPYLDGWMRNGTRFDRAYTATPTCTPARAALMTGLAQENHGRVGYRDGIPWDYDVTLPRSLAQAGYQTHAVGKMHVYPEREMLGFDDVVLHDGYLHHTRERYSDLAPVDDYTPWLRERLGYDADDFEHGLSCNSVVARPWDKPESVHPTNFVTQKAVEFLHGRDQDRPFFLYASYHRPHPPYDPPAWAFEQYVHEDMPDPPVGDWTDIWADQEDSGWAEATVAQYDPRILQRARAGYYGHMSHLDQQINRLLNELESTGAGDNTIVCFVSDHGESMGDHHLFRKSLPYEGAARIPFIITGPGIPAGVDTDHVVELRDVLPTLLDAAGLPVPDKIDGQSVLRVLGDAEPGGDGAWRPYLHGEHDAFDQSVHYLTDGRTKYIWCSGTGREQLFDLAGDPTELHDLTLADESAGDLARWRARLVNELTDRPEGFVKDGELVVGCPVDPVLPFLRERVGVPA